jgi:hypothetical protein
MSSADAKAFADIREPILPPYTQDPQRRQARVGRAILFAIVCLFCLTWGFLYAIFTPVFILFFVAPIPILAMLVIWALPDRRAPPLQALSPTLFMFMVGLVIWPNYIALALPGLPWISLTRIIGVPLVLILLVCASTSQEYRAKVWAAMKASPVVSSLFVAFTAMEIISIPLSRAPFFSFDAFVNAQINWTTIFFASVYVFQKPGRTERMIRLLWIMSIFVGVIALFEARVRHPLWAGHIPSFLQINDPAVKLMMAGGSRHGVYRAAATFGNALGLAEYIAFVLPFVVNYAIGPYRWSLRLAAAISIPFLLVVTVVSGSRLGFVGCFLSIVLSVGVWSVNRWRRDPESLVGPMTALAFPAGFASAIVGSFFIGFVRVRVWGGGDGTAASTDARKQQFALGWPKVLSTPWGHGIGTAADVLGYAPVGLLTIDTYYLSILLEFGFLGFVVYFGMFLWAAAQCAIASTLYRGKDREMELLKPLAIAVINFFIIKSVFSEVFNHAVIFMMLGMIVALLSRISQEKAVEATPATPAPPPPPPLPRARRTPGSPIPAPAASR